MMRPHIAITILLSVGELLQAASLEVRMKSILLRLDSPKSWRIRSSSEGLTVSSYPAASSVRGAVTPIDGADMHILVDEQIAEYADWSGKDVGDLAGKVRTRYGKLTNVTGLSIQRLKVSGRSGILSVASLDVVFNPGSKAELTELHWFTQIDGHLVHAVLAAYSSNPGFVEFKRIFEMTVESVRVSRLPSDKMRAKP